MVVDENFLTAKISRSTVTLCIHKLRNAQSLNYGPSLSPLLKKDNLHIKDKMPAPDLSVIRRFHCICKKKKKLCPEWDLNCSTPAWRSELLPTVLLGSVNRC